MPKKECTIFVCSGSSCRSPLAASIYEKNTGIPSWAYAAGRPGQSRSKKAYNASPNKEHAIWNTDPYPVW